MEMRNLSSESRLEGGNRSFDQSESCKIDGKIDREDRWRKYPLSHNPANSRGDTGFELHTYNKCGPREKGYEDHRQKFLETDKCKDVHNHSLKVDGNLHHLSSSKRFGIWQPHSFRFPPKNEKRCMGKLHDIKGSIRRSNFVGSPEDVSLVYMDPHGVIHGPFLGVDLIKWFQSGFFGLDLPVRLADAPYGAPFMALGNMMPHLKPKPQAPPGFDSCEPQGIQVSSLVDSGFGSVVKHSQMNLHGHPFCSDRSGLDGNAWVEVLDSTNLNPPACSKFEFEALSLHEVLPNEPRLVLPLSENLFNCLHPSSTALAFTNEAPQFLESEGSLPNMGMKESGVLPDANRVGDIEQLPSPSSMDMHAHDIITMLLPAEKRLFLGSPQLMAEQGTLSPKSDSLNGETLLLGTLLKLTISTRNDYFGENEEKAFVKHESEAPLPPSHPCSPQTMFIENVAGTPLKLSISTGNAYFGENEEKTFVKHESEAQLPPSHPCSPRTMFIENVASKTLIEYQKGTSEDALQKKASFGSPSKSKKVVSSVVCDWHMLKSVASGALELDKETSIKSCSDTKGKMKSFSTPAITGPSDAVSQYINDDADSEAFHQWCEAQVGKMKGLDMSLLDFCIGLTNKEAGEYLSAYLGEGPEVEAFVMQFLHQKDRFSPLMLAKVFAQSQAIIPLNGDEKRGSEGGLGMGSSRRASKGKGKRKARKAKQ